MYIAILGLKFFKYHYIFKGKDELQYFIFNLFNFILLITCFTIIKF